MTRIELMQTLERCGLKPTPRHDGRIHIPGYEPNPMTEAQAFQVIDRLATTHCLHCGRRYEAEENQG